MVDCKVLFVDDDELIRRVMERGLGTYITQVACAENPTQALTLLEDTEYDIVITDLRMNDHSSESDLTGINLIRTIKERHPNTEVILQTGFGTIDNAQRATRAGAYDYIEKPYKVEKLLMVVERALQHRRLLNEVTLLKQQVAFDYSYDGLLGDSVATLRFKETIAKAAESDTFILISGEKGSGKNTAAKIIHHHSLRRKCPLITFDCAGTPKRLIDSELFGPSNAHRTVFNSRAGGLLARANTGTLILKDIDALPIETQRKLASVLHVALNSTSANSANTNVAEVASDVRIIATTSRDLPETTIAGQFSTELLKLVEVTTINAPSLRDSAEDILPLAKRFMLPNSLTAKDFASHTERHLSGAALEKLMQHSWPENVAELKAVLRRANALAQSSEVTADDIFFVNSDEHTEIFSRVAASSSDGSLEMTYRARILKSLEDNKWNYSQTALELGIGRTTLWRKVKKYNLSKDLVSEKLGH